jgi:hypothetical protein
MKQCFSLPDDLSGKAQNCSHSFVFVVSQGYHDVILHQFSLSLACAERIEASHGECISMVMK